MTNPGKLFEKQFKDSVPEECYCLRIRDPAQSFFQNDSLRFSLQNPYDCFIYSFPLFLALELKSFKSTSITFYREDFNADEGNQKHSSFMIKKNQIEGLNKAAQYKGVRAGFVLNFRDTNHTYYLGINDFNRLSESIGKKSFNEKDVKIHNAFLIEQQLIRTRYRYDVDGLINILKKELEQ